LAISPDCGLKKVSIWNMADARLAHVARREADDRLVAELAHDVAAGGRPEGGERCHVRVVLETDVDDAVERDALPRETVLTGDARARLLLGGCLA